MSESGGASSHCNILDIINGDSSRENAENCTEFVNADEDTILPPVDGGQQAWAFMLGAFMIEGLMWGKYLLSHLNYLININRFPVSFWSLPNILSK
jgi:hypothetical protein